MEDKTERKDSGKTGRLRRQGAAQVAVILVLLLAAVGAACSFYAYLSQQLFIERRTHLAEITQKICQVVDAVVDATWQQVKTAGNVLRLNATGSEEELYETLDAVDRFLDTDSVTVMAVTAEGKYYDSEKHTGYWGEEEDLSTKDKEQQIFVVQFPFKDDTSMVFLRRLPEPKALGDEAQITYVALAVEMESLREVFSVSGFSDSCYTYIVKSNGRRVYRHTHSKEFLDGYNLISKLEQYEFINGGTVEDLQRDVAEGRLTGFEFDYEGENFFVASAPANYADWSVMLFVPTAVLGSSTGKFMRATAMFFMAIAGIIIILFSVVAFLWTKSQADRKLMAQQEEANALLSDAAEKAKAANEAKTSFLSHMSHDIRTPINGIMGMGNIALKSLDDRDRVEDCLRKIMSSSNHLLSLVNDVLDMSRVESGKTTISHDLMDLRAAIGNCVSIISGQTAGRELELITEFDPFEHPYVYGDELHLRQVLINILGNAVKFTPDGGTITFRARELYARDGTAHYHFEIEDTGIGMKEEYLEHIWTPFSQENGNSRTEYQGTGLGMTIAKQFVELMHGTISVKSRLNVGSKFTVEIPMEISGEGPQSAEMALPQMDFTGMRVLLVEDNTLNMEIARYMLEEEHISVTSAENGQGAVDLFAASEPGEYDAILMDIMMPVMDGLTAARAIRAMDRPDAKTIPILAMTANAYEEDVQRSREAGMNAHITKPLDVAVVMKTLENYYHQRQSE